MSPPPSLFDLPLSSRRPRRVWLPRNEAGLMRHDSILAARERLERRGVARDHPHVMRTVGAGELIKEVPRAAGEFRIDVAQRGRRVRAGEGGAVGRTRLPVL